MSFNKARNHKFKTTNIENQWFEFFTTLGFLMTGSLGETRFLLTWHTNPRKTKKKKGSNQCEWYPRVNCDKTQKKGSRWEVLYNQLCGCTLNWYSETLCFPLFHACMTYSVLHQLSAIKPCPMILYKSKNVAGGLTRQDRETGLILYNQRRTNHIYVFLKVERNKTFVCNSILKQQPNSAINTLSMGRLHHTSVHNAMYIHSWGNKTRNKQHHPWYSQKGNLRFFFFWCLKCKTI